MKTQAPYTVIAASNLAHGLYPDIPEAEYRAWPALSYSGAKHLLRSGQHFRQAIDHPPPATPATELGTDLHTRVLLGKPGFDALYLSLPEGLDCRRAADKKIRDELRERAVAEGMLIRPAATLAMVEAMAASVERHPLAMRLLDGAEIETSLRWNDPASTAACKGRMDAFRRDAGTVIDLKSTLDASPAGFGRQALNFGYAIQSHAYLAGLRTLGIDADSFVFVALEKSEPFCCAVYAAPPAMLELGKRKWQEACSRYLEYSEAGNWPGYPTDIRELELPAWAVREFYTDDSTDETNTEN
jgi:exodeoxyribonuclease VIII